MDDENASREARTKIALEQDAAAGGRDARRVSFPDGSTATASVSLSGGQDGPYSASLRFKHGGRTFRRRIGPIEATSRGDALRLAWEHARVMNLLVE